MVISKRMEEDTCDGCVDYCFVIESLRDSQHVQTGTAALLKPCKATATPDKPVDASW